MPTKTVEASGSAALECPMCGHHDTRRWLQAPDRFHGRKQLYQMVRCGSCSVVWLDDPPPPDQMADHYGADYDRMIAAIGDSAIEERWRDPRKLLLQYKSGGALLDLGCSSGGFLAAVKSPGWELYGIEISESVASKARARTGAQVYVGDVLDAPYPSGMFDAITCFHVFEHLYHPRKVLEKVQKWLKPGGIFLTFMPNIDSAGERIFGSYWYALELPRHLFHFSPVSLRNLANAVDLEVVSLTTDRQLFIEASSHYILDELAGKLGITRTPMAKASLPGIPFRVARKAFRLTMLPLLTGLASMAGDGETIHAVFRKKHPRVPQGE